MFRLSICTTNLYLSRTKLFQTPSIPRKTTQKNVDNITDKKFQIPQHKSDFCWSMWPYKNIQSGISVEKTPEIFPSILASRNDFSRDETYHKINSKLTLTYEGQDGFECHLKISHGWFPCRELRALLEMRPLHVRMADNRRFSDIWLISRH